MGKYFKYGEREILYLTKKDKKLGEIIEKIGKIEREVIPDLFSSLMLNIVGQQISNSALFTIWNRLIDKIKTLTPLRVMDTADDDLKSLGISYRKVSYMKGIAQGILNNELNLDEIKSLSDEDIIEKLTSFKGIGRWTAEMILIFSLERPNVFSFGDYGIKKGLQIIYGHKEITKTIFEKYRKRFSPYCTTASLYLWAVAGGQIAPTNKNENVKPNFEN